MLLKTSNLKMGGIFHRCIADAVANVCQCHFWLYRIQAGEPPSIPLPIIMDQMNILLFKP